MDWTAAAITTEIPVPHRLASSHASVAKALPQDIDMEVADTSGSGPPSPDASKGRCAPCPSPVSRDEDIVEGVIATFNIGATTGNTWGFQKKQDFFDRTHQQFLILARNYNVGLILLQEVPEEWKGWLDNMLPDNSWRMIFGFALKCAIALDTARYLLAGNAQQFFVFSEPKQQSCPYRCWRKFLAAP